MNSAICVRLNSETIMLLDVSYYTANLSCYFYNQIKTAAIFHCRNVSKLCCVVEKTATGGELNSTKLENLNKIVGASNKFLHTSPEPIVTELVTVHWKLLLFRFKYSVVENHSLIKTQF